MSQDEEKSPDSWKKCNLSFLLNLDLDNTANEASSDSDTNVLQIDVSEVENYNAANKPTRQTMPDWGLEEMEEEIERQLDAKAAKTNLTATNVKNILKHVITNEHVMAMVQKRLKNMDDDIVFEPKLTRAKAKALAIAQPNIPWPITPLKAPTSEVQALIHEDLAEDESDEEYHPDIVDEPDDKSDDDKETDTSSVAPVESPLVVETETPDIIYDNEGMFKVPTVPEIVTEEENIGQRTRSKLCLSETPLEQIEQAFIPPDITTDMYDWDWEADEEWKQFLNEFTMPLPQQGDAEDDPEADPEYNILQDEESDFPVDKEELRSDKGVKVTRKELNSLVSELFEFADMYSNQQETPKKKKFPENHSTWPAENNSMNSSMIDLLPVLSEPELPKLVNLEQQRLLQMQFCQHVQLLAQGFVLTHKHPEWHCNAKIYQDNLNSLNYLSTGPTSAFNVKNLPDALKLVKDWEEKMSDAKYLAEYTDSVNEEMELEIEAVKYKKKYFPSLHPMQVDLISSSKALCFPELLPLGLLKRKTDSKMKYLDSEDHLIALGLEQFIPYAKTLPTKFKSDKTQYIDAVQLTRTYMVPCRDFNSVMEHIKKRRTERAPNVIKYYFQTGSLPKHQYTIRDCELIAPKNRPWKSLPLEWQIYLKRKKRKNDVIDLKCQISTPTEKMKLKERLAQRNKLVSDEILPSLYKSLTIEIDESARNVVVNMMPNVSTLNRAPKRPVDTSKEVKKNAKLKLDRPELDGEASENCQSNETEIQDVSARPIRLRMTSPRLAKIKSAQNMKLMSQTMTTKGSSLNCNVLSRKKNEEQSAKSEDEESRPSKRGDNEDEIAELMLASTTIKKNIARKKTKQAREEENMKRLTEAEKSVNLEERATKFADSYIQKLHVTLESRDPETFKSVLQLYLEYSEKLASQSGQDGINVSENKRISTAGTETAQDKLTIELYHQIQEKLKTYPDLSSDFLLFLTPNQASMIEKSGEHRMMLKMSEFINVAQVYFNKQPSRLAKVMQAITTMATDPSITVKSAKEIMGSALKGHSLILDKFLQVLPTGKPPESLLASHMFENLTCPVGPHDKKKVYDKYAPELYENMDLPVAVPQDDPYGGDACKCDCHSSIDQTKMKPSNEHCPSCGTRFLNGRLYLQTSQGLRPAKITFPGEDNEELENIARVSIKTADRLIPVLPTRRRRKSWKNENINEETSVKQSQQQQGSPNKDGQEGDKSNWKSKRAAAKSPPKLLDQNQLGAKVFRTHRSSKRAGESSGSKKGSSTSSRGRRKDKKADVRDTKSESENQSDTGATSKQIVERSARLQENDHVEWVQEVDLPAGKMSEMSVDIPQENDPSANPEKTFVSLENDDKVEASSDSENSINSDSQQQVVKEKPWTRQEDMVLLSSIKKEYSEKTFQLISETLEDRSIEQVKERCAYLLELLQNISLS